jgi:5-methylcytosine-specific restriction endonuclease McrA
MEVKPMKTDHYVFDPVFRASNFRCQYCGADLLADVASFVAMARDHLVPKSAGGPDGAHNRAASCAACDRMKGAYVPHDLADAQAYIARQRAWLEQLFQAVRRDVELIA